jgi:hypothetical protein
MKLRFPGERIVDLADQYDRELGERDQRLAT